MKKNIKVLMFGWEFPPHNSGGLGVACKGLSYALVKEGIDLIFVMPKRIPLGDNTLNFKFANYSKHINIKEIQSFINSPYVVKTSNGTVMGVENREQLYNFDLVGEVLKYSENAVQLAQDVEFDIIHAHDWLSFGAGIAAKRSTGKPLVVQIHATEFDRAGENGNKVIENLERQGFQEADLIISVSEYTKSIVVNRYKINPDKVRVVHNAVELEEFDNSKIQKRNVLLEAKKAGFKIVLSLGRITYQKNLITLLHAAKQILNFHPKTLFVFVGSGDMEQELIETAAGIGISDKVIFTGFLRGDDRHSVLNVSDIFVMPSISEPFGIVPLEALANRTPVLVSKQSGVSEVIRNSLQVDFWDIDEMTNKIVSVLKHESLQEVMGDHGEREVKKITWDKAAKKTIAVYNELLQ